LHVSKLLGQVLEARGVQVKKYRADLKIHLIQSVICETIEGECEGELPPTLETIASAYMGAMSESQYIQIGATAFATNAILAVEVTDAWFGNDCD
jgi:hypothetical protein